MIICVYVCSVAVIILLVEIVGNDVDGKDNEFLSFISIKNGMGVAT